MRTHVPRRLPCSFKDGCIQLRSNQCMLNGSKHVTDLKLNDVGAALGEAQGHTENRMLAKGFVRARQQRHTKWMPYTHASHKSI